MRDCAKNKQIIYVAHYLGKYEILDKDGCGTGVYEKRYTLPAYRKENVTSSNNPNNSLSLDMFGNISKYSVVLITSEHCEYTEGDIFWINKKVSYDKDGAVDYNGANYIFGGEHFTLNTKIIGLNTYNEKN